MPKTAWYPFYPADYLCDTMTLTLEEDGAYRRLLDWYWLHGPIPNDARTIEQILRVDGRKRRQIWPVLIQFFTKQARAEQTVDHPVDQTVTNHGAVQKDNSAADLLQICCKFAAETGFDKGHLPDLVSHLVSEYWHQARMDAEIMKATEKYAQMLRAGKLGVIARAKANGQPHGDRRVNRTVHPRGRARHSHSDLPTEEDQSSLPTSSAEKKSIQEKICAFSRKNGHECFDEFWKRYPRKEGKKRALDVWTRKKLESRERATPIIVDVVRRARDHQPWLDGFIPHASSYLNGERWEDDIKEATHG